MNDLLKKMTYGHYILTALKKGEEMTERNEDYIAAGTVNWVSQLSFNPIQVGVAVGQKSDLNETINYSGYFTVHLLAKEHKDLLEKFSGDNDISENKINGIAYKKEDGELVLPDALGFLKCKVVETVKTGDHHLYIGEPVEIKELNDQQAICTMDVPMHYTPEKAEV